MYSSQTLPERTAHGGPTSRRLLLVSIFPALTAGVAFELFLGHRHDYAGHYAAGYGGTLGALMVGLKSLPAKQFSTRGTSGVVWICIGCILLGAAFEATLFRLAKFDEVDFCNQSLGAVLAAIVALSYVNETKPADRLFDYGLIVGIAFLGAGGVFSVA